MKNSKLFLLTLISLSLCIVGMAYCVGELASRYVGAEEAPATRLLVVFFAASVTLLLFCYFAHHQREFYLKHWLTLSDPNPQLEPGNYIGELKGANDGDFLFLLHSATIAPSYGLLSLCIRWQPIPKLLVLRRAQLHPDVLSACNDTNFQLRTVMRRSVFIWKKTVVGGILMFHPRNNEITLTGKFPTSWHPITEALMQFE